MNANEYAKHLRRVHGIEEGTIYDPLLHDGIPAAAFGPLPAENGMIRPDEMDAEEDLKAALWEGCR